MQKWHSYSVTHGSQRCCQYIFTTEIKCWNAIIIHKHNQKLINILEKKRSMEVFLKYWYFGFHFPEPIYKLKLFYSLYKANS